MSMIRDSVFGKNSNFNFKIDLINVNTWRMEATIAQSLISLNQTGIPHAFLVGDAAHAFPPSGGFGMNVGIGDAFNLAHKLAYVE